MVTLSLTEQEHRLVKAWSNMQGMLMRDFFEKAFSRFVDERQKGERPTYLAVPRVAKAVCTQVDAQIAQGIREAAEADHAMYVDAYYTAVKEHLVRLSDEDGSLVDIILRGRS